MTARSQNRALLYLLGLLGCLGATLLSSCGSGTPLYPVRGEVYFNGMPAEGALVILHPVDDNDPKTIRPRGIVDAQGAFTLSSHALGDGAVAGEYIVTINWLDHKQRKGELVPNKLKGPETSRETSKRRVHIEPRPNDLGRFDLKE